MIALPGLTFFAGRQALGEQILANMGAAVRDGLIPNVFSADGRHAYNSVDASLWYVWAVQMLLQVDPQRMGFVKEHCWPTIKEILRAYAGGQVPFVRADEEGFLDVGDEQTQLTWMDAVVDGRPVTPRHGQPVEISALWYNALAFADHLARRFDEPHWQDSVDQRDRMRAVFVHRHWIERLPGRLSGRRLAGWRAGFPCAAQPAVRRFPALPHPRRRQLRLRGLARAPVPADPLRAAHAGPQRQRVLLPL